jgi:hypothetical protein
MECIVMKNRKRSSKPAPSTEVSDEIFLLGPPPVLGWEDSAAYDELLARVSDEVKPTGILEEIWVRDYVNLTWEVRRLCGIKICMIEATIPAAMMYVMTAPIHKRLTSSEEPQPLSERQLSELRSKSPLCSEEFTKKFGAGDPEAVKQAEKHLDDMNLTGDLFNTRAFLEELDRIERIDRLIAVAQARRNAALREITFHRATFAKALRERMRDFEEAEFEIVKPAAVKKDRDKDAA